MADNDFGPEYEPGHFKATLVGELMQLAMTIERLILVAQAMKLGVYGQVTGAARAQAMVRTKLDEAGLWVSKMATEIMANDD